jgi:ribonucleotide reductase alpha subunit
MQPRADFCADVPLASEIADTYWHAWERGLKGVTVYRYGSRESQVLELGAGEAAYHYDHALRCDPTECRV